MAKCHLIIDSCCDLPASVVRRPGVTLMKFPYTVDGGTFEDDLFESVSAEAFYGAMRKGADMLAVVFWGHDKRENLSVADRIARKVKGDK